MFSAFPGCNFSFRLMTTVPVGGQLRFVCELAAIMTIRFSNPFVVASIQPFNDSLLPSVSPRLFDLCNTVLLYKCILKVAFYSRSSIESSSSM